jgi:hypothetical protein
MWKDNKFEPSATRDYVAVCYTERYDGHYFRQFHLPEYIENGALVENTCAAATLYFTKHLFPGAIVECSIPLDQYMDLKDQDALNKRNQLQMERAFPKNTVNVKRKKR